MESDEFLFFHEKFTWTSKMDTVQIYLIDLVTTFLVARFRHLRMESDFFSQAGSWGCKHRKQGQQGQQRFRNPQIEFFESSSSGGVLGHRSLWRSHSPRLTLKHDWMPLSLRRHGVVIGRGMLWPQWGKVGNLLSGTLPSSWENWPEETFVWTGPRWIHGAFCSPRDPVKMRLQFYCLSFEATQSIQSI